MRDWYTGEFSTVNTKENVAGGGCVLVVDAKEAGIKNLVSTNNSLQFKHKGTSF